MKKLNEMVQDTITTLLAESRFHEHISGDCTAASVRDEIRKDMDPKNPGPGRYGARPGKAWKPVIRLLDMFATGCTRQRVRVASALRTIIETSKWDSFWEEHYIDTMGYSTHELERFLRYGGGGEYQNIGEWVRVRRVIRRYGPVDGRVPFSRDAAHRAGIPEMMLDVLLRDARHFDGGYVPKWVSTDPADTAPLGRFWNIVVIPVATILDTRGDTIGGVVYINDPAPISVGQGVRWPHLSLTRYLTWD